MKASQIEELAQELHRKLAINTKRPIDVFDTIRSLGIFLHFRPLDKLFGAFLSPEAGRFGILLNSEHPLSLRRFTAGHELGHYILGHGPDSDTGREIAEGGNYSNLPPQEKEANMFAAAFLMPSELLEHTARGLDIDLASASLSESQVLLLSAHIGCSHKATITRLRTLGYVDANWPRGDRHQPLEIKQALGGYKPHAIGRTGKKITWNDVVVVNETSANGLVLISEGQVLEIALKNRFTSGYVWELVGAPEGVKIEKLTRSLAQDHQLGVGTGVTFCVMGLEPGTHFLRFVKHRPWKPEEVLEECLIRVVVEPYLTCIDWRQLVA